MPSDLSTIADPAFVLMAWAAGLALSVGFVSLSQIVGPGFSWLSASVVGLIAIPASLAVGAWWGRVGLILVVLGLIWARNRPFAGLMFVLGSGFFIIEAASVGGILPAVSAGLALGGVTGEMILGHWYLVDPRMPRWALRSLAILGIAGLTADSLVISVGIGFPMGGGTWVFWMLVVTSVVLMVAVLASLRYPAYSGVMAATGLSYLAVLTSLGAVFLGRAIVVGLGPFSI